MSTLRLNRKLYTRAAINEAVSAFSSLATIDVNVSSDCYEVSFADVDPDVADVIDKELANFALAETIERR